MKNRDRAATGKNGLVAEIGNGWFKLAEMTVQRNVVAVSRLHLGRTADGEDVSPEAVAEAAGALGISGGRVTAFLPRELVTVRLLDLPSTAPRELADMIDLQVDKQTPYSSDEIISQFKVLGTDEDGYSRVMLVVVQRSVLRQRFYVLEEAGFDVLGMSVSSEGLVGWYTALSGESAPEGTCHALLDVDYSFSDFACVHEGRLCHAGSIRIGARHLRADPERGVDALCRDVDRSLAAFRAEAAGLTVGKLLVTGAGSRTRGLAARLGVSFDFEVETVATTAGIELGPGLPDLETPENAVFSLTPLVGLFARGEPPELNLVPEPVKMRKSLERKADSLHVFGVRLMAVFLLFCAALMAKLCRRQALLDEVSRRYEATEQEARDLENMRLKIQLVRERTDTRSATVNVLRELHRLISDASLHLLHLEIDEEQNVRLRGSARALSDAIKLVGLLENSSLFAKASLERTAQKKGTTDFEIVCRIEG